jgi:hypothetical protein
MARFFKLFGLLMFTLVIFGLLMIMLANDCLNGSIGLFNFLIN